MCDISREENKAINTQLAMKNIPLNSDVLSIVNSFLFQDKTVYAKQKMEQKLKKDNLMRIINDLPRLFVIEQSEGVAQWGILVPSSLSHAAEDGNIEIAASNCLKCGKYTQVSFLELESAIMDNKYIVCVNGEH